MRIETAGQDALIVYFADQTNPMVSATIQHAVTIIQAEMPEIIVDLVPSYASLLVIYDINVCDHFEIKRRLREALYDPDITNLGERDLVILPVYYSLESGPDLKTIADRSNISTDEVIDIHLGREYRVYAIGFAPGFAYLGEVDERIATPRLATPRPMVPRGAVAIADRQTAVYPAQSPGGWNLIGLCPTRMFDPSREPSMPVKVGDQIKFERIDRDEYIALGGTL